MLTRVYEGSGCPVSLRKLDLVRIVKIENFRNKKKNDSFNIFAPKAVLTSIHNLFCG